ncbi:MAG: hypothetical protein ACD_63C00146G0007 [uncultured bacterium]|nr:MAG: hypothetical protein ACD_63C00146G0007 [uncultured bacterium]
MESALTALYIILSVGAVILTAFVAYAMYQTAKTMKESRKTMIKLNENMEKADRAITAATEAITSVSQTVKRINDSMAQPMEGIIKGIQIAKTFIKHFKEADGDNYDCETKKE